MSTEQVPVITSSGERATWSVIASEEGPPWRLTLQDGNGREWSAEADDLFAAFQEIRRKTDREGIKLCVNGARRDAHPSGMSRDMGGGRMLYILPPKRGLRVLLALFRPPRRRNMVYIFDPAPCDAVVSVDEQVRYFDEWVGSDG